MLRPGHSEHWFHVPGKQTFNVDIPTALRGGGGQMAVSWASDGLQSPLSDREGAVSGLSAPSPPIR